VLLLIGVLGCAVLRPGERPEAVGAVPAAAITVLSGQVPWLDIVGETAGTGVPPSASWTPCCFSPTLPTGDGRLSVRQRDGRPLEWGPPERLFTSVAPLLLVARSRRTAQRHRPDQGGAYLPVWVLDE
jgi:hypothetical protein